MKCKVVLGGLAVIGILALSATAAQAGAGGVPSTLTGFFVCHEIKGDDPGRSFDVESPIFGPVDASGYPDSPACQDRQGSSRLCVCTGVSYPRQTELRLRIR